MEVPLGEHIVSCFQRLLDGSIAQQRAAKATSATALEEHSATSERKERAA